MDDIKVPEISVVIPTYKRTQKCARLVRGLSAQTLLPSNFEVLVVDDCSDDETTEVLNDLAREVPYRLIPLRTSQSGNPGRARNVGWRAALAKIIAFTDDDCLPEPNWLRAGLEALSADDYLGFVQGRTTVPEEVDESQFPRGSHRIEVDNLDPYFPTCNMFYRREALEQVGGFDEQFAFWGEDTHCGWSVLRAGWNAAFAPQAVVVHDVTYRPVKWYLRRGLDETNIVRIAAEFPKFRQEVFWRSWAYRREDAAFVAAVVSAMLALWWRPAALGMLPYISWRRPGTRKPGFIRACCVTVALDASRSIGQLRGAIKHRILVI